MGCGSFAGQAVRQTVAETAADTKRNNVFFMRAHLKSADFHPVTIVCILETGSNIIIIAHRQVKTKSRPAVVVLVALSMTYIKAG